jgi:threonine aldolase
MIDLRSDTVTKPTPAMRRAMAEAEVGDDVYGEDPTLNLLERRAAEIMGKEAAVFVPTGTMGNVIAIKVLTEHGDEVVCDSRAHLFDWELSMVAWFSGCQIRTATTERGIMSWDQVNALLRPGSPHSSRTGAVALENTHNMGGGSVYPQETIDRICDESHARGVNVHLDGARIFNASEATGTPVSRIAQKADTVMFCLSKALGAPVGSMLAGPSNLIERGRLYRKRLGGGMRQVGVLAAAGLIALEETPKRLGEDHANARAIASRLARIEGIAVNPVETNIVIFDVSATGVTPQEIGAGLKERGVLMNCVYGDIMRAVTHYGVSHADCMVAMDALEEVLAAARRRSGLMMEPMPAV